MRRRSVFLRRELLLRFILHVIQQSDVGQGLRAERGIARSRLVELAPRMGPAGDLGHLAAGLTRVDAVVAAERIGL